VGSGPITARLSSSFHEENTKINPTKTKDKKEYLSLFITVKNNYYAAKIQNMFDVCK